MRSQLLRGRLSSRGSRQERPAPILVPRRATNASIPYAFPPQPSAASRMQASQQPQHMVCIVYRTPTNALRILMLFGNELTTVALLLLDLC